MIFNEISNNSMQKRPINTATAPYALLIAQAAASEHWKKAVQPH